MTPNNNQEFLTLKAEVEAHARLCGYYIIKLVDITEMREGQRDQEEIAEKVFEYFDDQTWPPIEQRPRDQSWAEYAAERNAAKDHAIEALVGGPSVGHTVDTISRPVAEQYFERFEALFDDQRHYYIRMAFGDNQYVFLHGVAIISRSRAGVLWVVEDDSRRWHIMRHSVIWTCSF